MSLKYNGRKINEITQQRKLKNQEARLFLLSLKSFSPTHPIRVEVLVKHVWM
jgi:hypothetical protein